MSNRNNEKLKNNSRKKIEKRAKVFAKKKRQKIKQIDGGNPAFKLGSAAMKAANGAVPFSGFDKKTMGKAATVIARRKEDSQYYQKNEETKQNYEKKMGEFKKQKESELQKQREFKEKFGEEMQPCEGNGCDDPPSIDAPGSKRTPVMRENFTDLVNGTVGSSIGELVEPMAYGHFNALAQTFSILIENIMKMLFKKLLECKELSDDSKVSKKKKWVLNCKERVLESEETAKARKKQEEQKDASTPGDKETNAEKNASAPRSDTTKKEAIDNSELFNEDEINKINDGTMTAESIDLNADTKTMSLGCQVQCMFETPMMFALNKALDKVDWNSSIVFSKPEIPCAKEIKNPEQNDTADAYDPDKELEWNVLTIYQRELESDSKASAMLYQFLSPQMMERVLRKAMEDNGGGQAMAALEDAKQQMDESLDDMLREIFERNTKKIQEGMKEDIKKYIADAEPSDLAKELMHVQFKDGRTRSAKIEKGASETYNAVKNLFKRTTQSTYASAKSKGYMDVKKARFAAQRGVKNTAKQGYRQAKRGTQKLTRGVKKLGSSVSRIASKAYHGVL